MSTNTIDQGNPGQSKSFWTAGRWFVFLICFLFIWIGLYLFTHWDKVRNGYQVTQFSSSHIDQLNRILYTSSIPVMPAPQLADTTSDPETRDSVKRAIAGASTRSVISPTQICDDTCRINKALLYVRTEFDNKLQPEQEDIIKAYISTFSAQEVGSYLAQLKLKVVSYFWLSGPFMYIEMVFWVIFGVICSNIFMLGILGRTRGFSAFNPHEVPYQVAKFFYAPFCTIIIILAYNYYKHSNVVEVFASEGMIIFSFIIGLFSGRLMSFIERFKDVILPETAKPAVAVSNGAAPAVAPVAMPARKSVARNEVSAQEPQPTYTEEQPGPIADAMQPHTVINDLYKEDEPDVEESDDDDIPEEITPAYEAAPEPAPVVPGPAVTEPEAIPEVMVLLNLDVSGLYEEEKNEIIGIGFANAVVTLHNVNGRDVLTAKKSDDRFTASFIAANVKPGIYITRCTLTQKLSDDYVVNLFGEKTAYITNENKNLELYIKKYEAI